MSMSLSNGDGLSDDHPAMLEVSSVSLSLEAETVGGVQVADTRFRHGSRSRATNLNNNILAM